MSREHSPDDREQLVLRDETARRSLEVTREEVASGAHYTIPWLNLDLEAYRAYREKQTDRLPEPFCSDPASRIMMADVQGRPVLCLAGGGGQQSAAFSLLGATVTVLDLTPEQLASDRKAARHYGYEVTTIQGDMRDLSMFADGSFDRVYQPPSTFYAPDLRELYAGVARVLKPGGLYYAEYGLPMLYVVQDPKWNGEGYSLLITQPYTRGAIFETEGGNMNFAAGEFFGEYHHLFSDIINGQIAEGLMIRGLWESPRPDHPAPAGAQPDSEEHRNQYIPYGLSVVSQKGSA